VVSVWLTREIYPISELSALKTELMSLSTITEGMLQGTEMAQVDADMEMPVEDDLQVHDLIVFKQTSLTDMDHGHYDNGRYHLVDPVWLEIVQQLQVVKDNRKMIEQAEAKLNAEFAVNEEGSQCTM
jgi:hypothetical protein